MMTEPSARTRRTHPLAPLRAFVPALLAAAILVMPIDVLGSGETAVATGEKTTNADTVLHWITASEGNEARYRVREQLARFDFPNDAVGVTTEVSGEIRFTPDGRIDGAGSGFTIGLHALASDSDRRDNFLRRNTLATETNPDARFQPREVRGLDLASMLGDDVGAGSGADVVRVEFDLVGDLTIRETTRQVVWAVQAEIGGGAVRGEARTAFTFGEFDLEVPRVGSVLSINDDIRLEYDFHLVPAGS